MNHTIKRFEKIADGAYFAIDTRAFQTTINTYNPVLANQIIVVEENSVPLDVYEHDQDLLTEEHQGST